MSNIGSVFERFGGELRDPPIVMPAALPLELSGESVRSRLCIFTDNHNRDVALRPDLTLSLALEEVERRRRGDNAATTVRYSARAYRLPRSKDDPVEFTQIGVERYGYPTGPQIDAELYSAVSEEILAADVVARETRFGDLAIFDSFVSGLDLGTGTQNALKRAFREEGGIRAILDRPQSDTANIASKLSGMSSGDAKSLVQNMIDMADMSIVGTRTLDEIVERLLDQAAGEDVQSVSVGAKSVLRELTDTDIPFAHAADELRALAQRHGLSKTDAVLEILAERYRFIRDLVPTVADTASFNVGFGRRFTYYDGFVFEIIGPDGDSDRPIGAGGRYDTLLPRLSAGDIASTAIGGVVRPDRLAIAKARGQ